MPSLELAPPSPPLRYRVTLDDPHSHELQLRLEVPALPERTLLRFAMPAWAPGSYMIRDFARHVYDLRVTDLRGRSLPLERLDKQRWEVVSAGQPVRIEWRVFAFEETVRTSFFDDRHAYFNGSSVFFYLPEELERPCLVEIEPPRGWVISTALPRLPGPASIYRAGSYDELADSPFEVGTHALHAFQAGRTVFEVAIYGRTNADVPRLLRDLRKIVTATGAMFGGFPFERYLFIIHCLAARGGGLEHAACCTLDIAGFGFEEDKAYQRFNELAAHEFFHVWNVKRIRDRVLGPFDYGRENYTRLLWFHEGFTEYMESLVLLRAGLLDAETYIDDLAEDWPKYLARPGRNVTPLTELSLEAWIKLYKPADNHPNRTVSYYEKGKWAALVLEIFMREATQGRRGLEQLFRRLWNQFGRRRIGIGEADIETAVADTIGKPLRPYFARYIRGTEELPVPALLRRAGLRVQTRAPWQQEAGGDRTRARRLKPFAGISWVGGGPGGAGPAADRALVRSVVPDSPAWLAGMTYGDEVLAVDGQRVNAQTAPRRLADRPPGSQVVLHLFRRDGLQAVTLTLGASPERKLRLSFEERPGELARAVRHGWLGV
jgi:predicted metalloprotease with PDZ domain